MEPVLVVYHRNLAAYIVLLHGGHNLRRPFGDMVVRPNSFEEVVADPIRVQGGLDGVLVPLPERLHDPGTIGVGGASNVRGELVYEDEDPSSDLQSDLRLVVFRVFFVDFG